VQLAKAGKCPIKTPWWWFLAGSAWSSDGSVMVIQLRYSWTTLEQWGWDLQQSRRFKT